MKGELPRFSERKGLQIVHQTGEQLCLLQRVVDMFRGRLIHTIQDALKVALDDMERCAEFMCNISSEIAALLFCALQFTGHFVEAFDQFAEHIRIVFRHTRPKIALGNRIDGVEYLLQWFAVSLIQVKDDDERDDDHNDGSSAKEKPPIPDPGEFRKDQIKKGSGAPDKKQDDAKNDNGKRKETTPTATLPWWGGVFRRVV